ncbi:MAG: efflux RND transporter permease subunit [Bdellovibrionota bacterium]
MRVYLLFALLAAIGVYCGTQLPVSLFPNSSKPRVVYGIPYGNMTGDEFLHTYGKDLESKIMKIDTGDVKVIELDAEYRSGNARYDVQFEWGTNPNAAASELSNTVMSFVAQLPTESREGMWHWVNQENAGFFAISFFSAQRSLDELYDIIEPAFRPGLSKIKDAEEAVVYNPSRKEIRIELDPEAMAALQLFPKDVNQALSAVLSSYQGGSVTMGTQTLQVQMPRTVNAIEDLGNVPVATPSGQSIHLSDISRIDFAPSSTWTRSFKTNGASSLILFGTPVAGGNIKRMSEEFLRVIDEVAPTLPKDIQRRVLVDPSEFIRNSIANVLHEVLLAALIATAILFFFIGSARNVLTAALEIPLSMVLAFILMRLFGMNLNLISLGGLALSAGMNVDASVVVMENIFRHFKEAPKPLSFNQRLDLIVEAVQEVKLPVIASTIASLVVFLPLAFTSELTYAILGDLAKAVVFSHGFSAIVALILVPTIRLQLMEAENKSETQHSRIQSWIKSGEDKYAKALEYFLHHGGLRVLAYGGLTLGLVLLAVLIIPRLPKELVGKPDTDWMVLGIRTEGNTQNTQMESQALEVERRLLDVFGERIAYTFNQVNNPNAANLMARLRDKSDMNPIWKEMEAEFTNTPLTRYWVGPWNPSELEIPDPPHMKISVRSSTYEEQIEIAREVEEILKEKKIFDRVHAEPNLSREKGIVLTPHLEQWSELQKRGSRVTPSDLSDLIRVATDGRRVGYLPVKDERMPILMRYPLDQISLPEEVAALPVGIGSKIIPLKALAGIGVEDVAPSVYRKNEQTTVLLEGRTDKDEEHLKDKKLEEAKALVGGWKEENKDRLIGTSVIFEDAAIELTEALDQLTFAMSLSLGLIFFTLLLQFGDVVPVLLILVAIPLGFVGVIGALWLFGSTLSLNSALGVILLNGIAVANSILLVDFIRRLVDDGMAPKLAAVEAGRKRLRPILITSLTTILGMLPIAFGAGDGGRILQPLGITVSAGLWVSTALTLFVVPALQVAYLEWRSREDSFPWLKDSVGRAYRAVGRWRPWRTADAATATRLDLSPKILWFVLAFWPAVIQSAPLAFQEALSTIVERSTRVNQQTSVLDATRASNVPADLVYLPKLSLGADYEIGKKYLGSNESRTGGLNATAELNLFKFGADRNAQNRAHAENAVQEDLLKDSVLKAEDDAVSAIIGLTRAERQRDIRERSTKIREDALRIAEERFKKGLLAKQEVDKVRIERDNATATLKDAEAAVISARASLTALLGHADIVAEWPFQQSLYKGKQLTEESTDQLKKRPDWQAAEHRLEASEYYADETFGNILPSLDLSGSYGYQKSFSGSGEGSTWSAGISLSIPLFDGLSRLSTHREKVYLKSAAEWGLENTRRQAKSEWESAKGAFTIALETAKVRDQTVQIAEKLYNANLQRFQRGLTNVNDLILDQDRLFNAELLRVSGWANAHLSFTQLCHATGKRLADCL